MAKNNDKKFIIKTLILGIFGVIFVFATFALNSYLQISSVKTNLLNQISSVEAKLDRKKTELYGLIDAFSQTLDGKNTAEKVKAFANKEKMLDAVFVMQGANVYKSTNKKYEFSRSLNFENLMKSADKNGFFLSRTMDNGKNKGFFVIKKAYNNQYIVAVVDMGFAKQFANENIHLTDKNGESLFGKAKIYNEFKVNFSDPNLQYLSKNSGGSDFVVSRESDDFDIQISASCPSKNLFLKLFFVSILLLLALLTMIYLLQNLIKIFKENYVRPIDIFSRILSGKNMTERASFDKNPKVRQIISDILRLQTSLKMANSNNIVTSKKFTQIFNNDVIAYIYVDRSSGAILQANNSANRLFDVEDLTKFNIFDIKKTPYQMELYNQFAAQNAGKNFQVTQYKINDKTINVRENIEVINEDDGNYLFYTMLDITDYQKFIDDTAKERQNFGLGPYVVIDYDIEKREVLSITRNVESLWGYFKKSFSNGDLRIKDIIDENDYERVHREMNNSLEIYKDDKSKDTFTHAYKIKHKSKHIHNYKVFVRFISEKEAILYFYQIDDVVKQQNALDKEILRHENIINAASFATWEWDINSQKLKFNDNFPKIRGYNDRYFEVDLSYAKFANLIHGNDLLGFSQKVKNYFNGIDHKLDAEFRMQVKNGYKWMHMQGAVLEKNTNGTMRFLCGILEDISERKKADYQMRLNANVFAYANEGIVIMDENFVISDVNKGFERIMGYKKSEIIGKNYSSLNTEETNKKIKEALESDRFFRDEIYSICKNGDEAPQILTINAIDDPDNEKVHYIAIFFEITAIKEREKELRQIALHDFLTKLPNRILFTQTAKKAVENGGEMVTILYFDFDGFKAINDTYGHDAGDDFLRMVSVVLGKAIGDKGLLARLGGDEFGAVINKTSDKDEILALINELLKVGEQKFDIAGTKIGASVSIGVNFYNGKNYELAIKQADDAMYIAKTNGKNRYHIYEAGENTEVDDEKLKFEKALKNDEFFMLYQPIFDIKNHRIDGFELLLRWMHNNKGLLNPSEFLPIIEEIGGSEIFNVFVLNEAIKFSQYFIGKFGFTPRIHINFNVEDLFNRGFYAQFTRIIEENSFDASNLAFELVNLNEKNAKIVLENHNMYEKFGIALMSNKVNLKDLNFMQDLPLKALKTDMHETLGITGATQSIKYLAKILDFCKKHKLECIAQGVEYKGSLRLLKTFGFELVQGDIVSPPLLLEEIEDFCNTPFDDISPLSKQEFEYYKLAFLHNRFIAAFISLIKENKLNDFNVNNYESAYVGIKSKFNELDQKDKFDIHTEIYKQILGILSHKINDNNKAILHLQNLSKKMIENI